MKKKNLLHHRSPLHPVHQTPILLTHPRPDMVANLLIRRGKRSAIGVVDNGNFIEVKRSVLDEQAAEGVADVAAYVAVDDGFCWVVRNLAFGGDVLMVTEVGEGRGYRIHRG